MILRTILWLFIAVLMQTKLAIANTNTSNDTFGFNYWPSNYLSDSLFDENWPTQKNIIEKDIVQMKALGAGVVRITFWPDNATGWWLSKDGTGSTFNSNYYELTNNLPSIMQLFAKYDIKVIVVFYNTNVADWMTNGMPNWMAAYGKTLSGWQYFLRDSKLWMDGIVNSIEGSPYKGSVIYYDMANEWWMNDKNIYDSNRHYEQWYLNFIYDNALIPEGKRGISTLATAEYVEHIKLALGTRTLDYYDIHSYPADAPQSGNIEDLYNIVRGKFPNATILMGEFGRRNTQGGEAAQVETFLDLRQRALIAGYRYTLNWTLWDDPISVRDGFGYGFGVNPQAIRDLMGAHVNAVGFLTNPDFEWGDCRVQPYGWTFAADAGVQPSLQHNTVGVDSGRCNARMIAHSSQAGAQAWMCSSTKQGALIGKKRLFANFFVRTSMKRVRLVVFEYRSDGSYITSTASDGYDEAVWTWRNFISAVGPWHVELSPNAVSGAICIIGQTQNTTDYLDVDVVSAWAQ